MGSPTSTLPDTIDRGPSAAAGGAAQSHRLSDRTAVWWLVGVMCGMTGLALLWVENFFLRDDMQDQYLGGYVEVVRAWSEGELPLLSLLSWHSSALAGEYQYGVFSPFLVLTNAGLFAARLPLVYVAAILVLVHLLVLSSGAYVLARSKRLSPPIALTVALASSLNGWLAFWGIHWFPALASFAWLPWAWWALEQSLVRRDHRWAFLAGLFVFLLVTAGWPYTCLMIALVAAMLAGRAMHQRQSFAGAWPVVLGMVIGLGLSAPSWLMLVEYSGATVRGQSSNPLAPQTEFLVPIKAYFGTILPTLTAPWDTPWQSPHHPSWSIVMHVGLAPVVLLIAAAFVLRSRLLKELRLEWMFLLMLFFLATFPSIGMFKWSFRWLPLLFLQLSLTAGRAAECLRRHDSQSPPEKHRHRYGVTAFFAVSLVASYALFIDKDYGERNLWFIAGLGGLALLWMVADRVSGPHRAHLPWHAVVVSSIITFIVVFRESPFDLWNRQVEARDEKVFDPSITYLALYSEENYATRKISFPGQRFYPGNEHMHSGLRFVNGYSPLAPAALSWIFGFNYIGALTPRELRPGNAARHFGPLLRRMAVDGLVVWPNSRGLRNIPFEEFEADASIPGAAIYLRRGGRSPRAQIVRQAKLANWAEKIHLRGPSPESILEIPGRSVAEPRLLELGDATITAFQEKRNHVRVTVDARGTDRPVLVSFARPWFPGYRVFIDGKAAEVGRLDYLFPAVEVPGGRVSRAHLVYRPTALIVGGLLAALTLAGLLLGHGLAGRRRRR